MFPTTLFAIETENPYARHHENLYVHRHIMAYRDRFSL